MPAAKTSSMAASRRSGTRTKTLRLLFQYEIMRDRSEAVPAFNDTPAGAPYLWNFLGFTRPSGDPLDHMGATNRNDSLLKMGEGPDHRRRRLST